ncbi:MAG: NAD(P)H-dependent glycerol-3-phosphate dehydrogenase [Acetobacter sp.]|jgi:glycerol-3-phosphate dehydrogenase (NAD(P)+)
MKHIVVAGAGAWGIALAIHASRTGAAVTLQARSPQERLPSGAMPRLPEFPLPQTVKLSDVVPTEADLYLVAVPTQALASFLPHLPQTRAPVVLCCKGVEQNTLRLPLQILGNLRPDLHGMVLSGPNFAHEIAAGLPAATVIAGSDIQVTESLTHTLTTDSFRFYGSDDPLGVQLGGAAKNVIAIAAGAAIGAGMGENARAALITRGIAEIGRLTSAMGGQTATLAGLSGIGDLMLTCTGTSSRNFRTGHALGQGATLKEALDIAGGVAEGVYTSSALLTLAHQHHVDAPIVDVVSRLLEGRISLRDARDLLLRRPARMENETSGGRKREIF